jgi:flagellar hook-length control protein FliK
MQNLPIATSQPASSSAQTLAAMDSGATDPASEPFNAVLARQIADISTTDSSQPMSSGSIVVGADATATITNDESHPAKSKESPATALDTLPADMLAALLPTASGIATTEGNATQKKAGPQEKTIMEEIAANTALPGAILVALQPANHATTTQDTAAQPAAIKSGIKDNAQQPLEFQTKPAASHIQDNIAHAIASGGNVIRPDSFAAKLTDSLGEHANPAQNSIQQPAQTDATTLSGMVQGNTLPPASQNSSMQLAVNTPITQDAWGGEFNQKITWLATQHTQSAELHLNPPHLGPLDVVLNVSGDQATALFTSPHSAVRDAVTQALPRLREMLAENGIMLGNATVSDQAPRDQKPFDNRQASSSSWSGRNADIAPIATTQANGTVWPIRRQQGMVDTFA